MMILVAVIMPMLTAPAEPSARARRQSLAVRLDSLTTELQRARTSDSLELGRRVQEAREGLAAADDHLAGIMESRQGHWRVLGPGTVLVGFGILLVAAGVAAGRR